MYMSCSGDPILADGCSAAQGRFAQWFEGAQHTFNSQKAHTNTSKPSRPLFFGRRVCPEWCVANSLTIRHSYIMIL